MVADDSSQYLTNTDTAVHRSESKFIIDKSYKNIA